METPLIIQESSQLGQALTLAGSLGMPEEHAGKVALIVSEIGTNLLEYGGGGEIVLRPFCDDTAEGVEIIALDQGPGIADLTASTRDGHSTSGTLGFGLGAIARLSSRHDAYTKPGGGTAILARVDAPRSAKTTLACRASPVSMWRARCGRKARRYTRP